MYCSHCGKPMRQGARFCVYCGKPALILTPQPPASAAATPQFPPTTKPEPVSAAFVEQEPETAPELGIETPAAPEPEVVVEAEAVPEPEPVAEAPVEPEPEVNIEAEAVPEPEPVAEAPVGPEPEVASAPAFTPAAAPEPAAEPRPVPPPRPQPRPAPEYAPAPAYPKASQKAPAKKKNFLVPLLIGLCVLILALLAGIAFLLVPMLKKGEEEPAASVVEKTKKPVATEEPAATDAPAQEAATMTEPEASAAPVRKVLPDTEKMPDLKEGEIVFWGACPCEGAEEVSIRFILSADRKTIHHLRITANKIKSKSSSVSKVSISTDGSNEVTFPGVTANISLGECHLYDLTFDDENIAHVRLKFVFKQPSIGGSASTTVELPEISMTLEAVDLP